MSGSGASGSSCRHRATTASSSCSSARSIPAIRWALDLRDESWDGVETRLAEVGAVRVDDWQAPAGWCYLRFRDPPYDETALDRLAARIRPLGDADVDVFAFFRHEDEPTAPRYAQRLRELLAQPSATPTAYSGAQLEHGLAEHLRVPSTSASVVAGDMSAMLWNGVSRMPRLSA